MISNDQHQSSDDVSWWPVSVEAAPPGVHRFQRSGEAPRLQADADV